MAETLRLFVSATKDLEAERAIIGRAVAELPVKIGIEIRRTPVDGATYETMYELIGNCDRVYFLMGRDITAPAGAEWLIAWKLERSVMPLRLAGLPTPAGQDFMRLLPASGWQRFASGAELARLVTLDLVELLNHPKNRYGLSVTELELLNRHGRRIKQARIKTFGEPGGAEGGGSFLMKATVNRSWALPSMKDDRNYSISQSLLPLIEHKPIGVKQWQLLIS